MPKKSTQPNEKKAVSKKIDAAVIVALIALMGTLATALLNSSVITEWLKSKPQPTIPVASLPPVSTVPASADPTSSNSNLPISSNDKGCLAEYFADVAPDKLISIEVGVTAQDHQFSGQDLEGQEFVGPFGVKLTRNGQPIAAFHFLFFINSELFKLTSVVNANCEAVSDYSNARGGDQNAIENSGRLNLRLAEGLFQLNFQRSGLNQIRFNFKQIQ